MIVDLFAGLGGWDIAARQLGMEVVGLEHDKWACATREAAGLVTMQCDLDKMTPWTFCKGVIASPPCQAWSTAGKRAGLDDPRGRLVFVPLAWIDASNPEWVVMEQVPPVLPIWKEYAAHLEERGYSTWTGILNAEQFGVPQTRKRAILIASRTQIVRAPRPTHSAFYSRDPKRLDPDVAPWISMAEALGWDEGERVGFARRNDLETDDEYRARDFRDVSLPAFNLTEKARSWTRERPAPTIVTTRRSTEGLIVGRQLPEGEERNAAHGGWTLRSSQSVAGGPRAERDAAEPAVTVGSNFDRAQWTLRTNRDGREDGTRQALPIDLPAPTISSTSGSQMEWAEADEPGLRTRAKQGDGVSITLEEALILQGFPRDYPVQGVKTRKFLQVGNAIPPPLALAILTSLHNPS